MTKTAKCESSRGNLIPSVINFSNCNFQENELEQNLIIVIRKFNKRLSWK
jgi:hypothetical protein